jgi:hypothetical protein
MDLSRVFRHSLVVVVSSFAAAACGDDDGVNPLPIDAAVDAKMDGANESGVDAGRDVDGQ